MRSGKAAGGQCQSADSFLQPAGFRIYDTSVCHELLPAELILQTADAAPVDDKIRYILLYGQRYRRQPGEKFEFASGKAARSILISAGARMAPFDIQEVRFKFHRIIHYFPSVRS